jgi:hypothetical protein
MEEKDYHRQAGKKMIATATVPDVIRRVPKRDFISIDHLIIKAAHFLRKTYQLRVHPSEAP